MIKVTTFLLGLLPWFKYTWGESSLNESLEGGLYEVSTPETRSLMRNRPGVDASDQKPVFRNDILIDRFIFFYFAD